MPSKFQEKYNEIMKESKTRKTNISESSDTVLNQYEDVEDMADELADELAYYIEGTYDLNKDEIIFYEARTASGEPADVLIQVELESGTVKVGMTVEGKDGPTYDDGRWAFDSSKTIREVADVIGEKANEALQSG